jgi:WD40 repeat protein
MMGGVTDTIRISPQRAEEAIMSGDALLYALTGHRGCIWAAAITADGRRAISGSDDTTLKVWDLEHGKELATLAGHSAPVRAVAISPDGKYAISGSDDATVKMWDVERGKELVTLSGHSGTIWTLAVTPDGRHAISGAGDQTLKVWDLANGRQIRTLTHGSSVWAVAVTPNGSKVVSAARDRTTKIWELDSGNMLAVRGWQSAGDIRVVMAVPRQTERAAWGHCWTWDIVASATILLARDRALALTPDSKLLVVADSALRVWNVKDERVWTIDMGHEGVVRALAMTPDGRRAVTGASDRTLRVWDLERVADEDERSTSQKNLARRESLRLRWQGIDQVFHADLSGLPPGRRASFRDPEYASDASLRHEIEDLLSVATEAEDSIPTEREKIALLGPNKAIRGVDLDEWLGATMEYPLLGPNKAIRGVDCSEPVRIGASAPRRVRAGKEFTARLAAYNPTLIKDARDALRQRGAKSHENLAQTSWKLGAKVRVLLTGTHLSVEPESQEFVWEGKLHIVNFDVKAPDAIEEDIHTSLKFDLFLVDVPGCAPVPVARVRLALEIRRKRYWLGRLLPRRVQFAARPAFQTAFASYHADERANVLTRLDAIQQLTGMAFFHECLSVHPRVEREPLVQREIVARDLFLLFWSRRAAESREVEWEWRTALERKGLEAMQAQRLEPEPLLPPELEPLDRTADGQNLAALGTALAAGVARQKSKILFFAADPTHGRQRALDEEAREIAAKIRAAAHRDALAFETRWAVRPDDLLQVLNEDRPAVVHFSGHGTGEFGIALHDDAGGAKLVTAAALQRLFAVLRDDIRLVVLNACYSHEQALAVAEVIDCVIGMSDHIGDDAARAFAAAFYRALGFGRSVRNAFDQGLAAIALEGLEAEHVPMLLARAGVDPGSVYIVEPSNAAARVVTCDIVAP